LSAWIYSRLPSVIVLLPYTVTATEPIDEGSMYSSALNISRPNVFCQDSKY
jgi:hypothetical protein